MTNKLVVANWKMFGRLAANELLIQQVKLVQPGNNIVICPPFPYLAQVSGLLADSGLALGAQNLSQLDQGAHTGEVSGPMLRDLNCAWVIVGHSERRSMYGDTDQVVGEKAVAAHRNELTPIVCVGEYLQQRRQGFAKRVVVDQLRAVFDVGGADLLQKSVIAYEPVWAIGGGAAATTDDVAEMHVMIKAALAEWGIPDAPVIYGGSVKPENAAELMSVSSVDGVLVGGASLDAAQFVAICRAAG